MLRKNDRAITMLFGSVSLDVIAVVELDVSMLGLPLTHPYLHLLSAFVDVIIDGSNTTILLYYHDLPSSCAPGWRYEKPPYYDRKYLGVVCTY
jgi:hypothetical protein